MSSSSSLLSLAFNSLPFLLFFSATYYYSNTFLYKLVPNIFNLQTISLNLNSLGLSDSPSSSPIPISISIPTQRLTPKSPSHRSSLSISLSNYNIPLFPSFKRLLKSLFSLTISSSLLIIFLVLSEISKWFNSAPKLLILNLNLSLLIILL
ncbi:uncharacterized protein ASCRUDRAFT_78330, partial [Ascoidea rubescens DSM 1968]